MEIKNEIIRESFEKLNSLKDQEFSYFEFVNIVNTILTEIHRLMMSSDNEEDKKEYYDTHAAITHALTKEVKEIEYKEIEMKKNNAAQIRWDEHDNLVTEAYETIHADITKIIHLL